MSKEEKRLMENLIYLYHSYNDEKKELLTTSQRKQKAIIELEEFFKEPLTETKDDKLSLNIIGYTIYLTAKDIYNCLNKFYNIINKK
ncbi:MAG: hypothetical protein R3Y43_03965 [Alphaproteobacteria bacterium]